MWTTLLSILAKVLETLQAVEAITKVTKKIKKSLKKESKSKVQSKKPSKYKKPASKKEAVEIYFPLIKKLTNDILSPELVFAIGWMESGFNPKSYRYEPNYDKRYVYQKIDKKAPYRAYTTQNMSVADWFDVNSKRAKKERKDGRDYNYPAQLRIAASYGIMQLMFPTAVGLGYDGPPEDLYNPEKNILLGVRALWANLKRYRNRELDAIAAYNAGSARRQGDLYVNQHYVDTVVALKKQFKKIIESKKPESF